MCVCVSCYPHPQAGPVWVVVALWGRDLWLSQEAFAGDAALALCAARAHYCTHRYAHCCAAVPRVGGGDWTRCSHFNVYVLIGFLPPPERGNRTKDYRFSLPARQLGQGGTAAPCGWSFCPALCWVGPSSGGALTAVAACPLFAAPCGAEPCRVIAASLVSVLRLGVGGCWALRRPCPQRISLRGQPANLPSTF